MVFQKFIAHEVSEMVLSLTNKDKVSAGTWSFKTVLNEESGVIPTVYSKASYLLQHMQKKMSQVEIFVCWEFSTDFGHALMFTRLVKVYMERSPYFELLCPNDAYRIIPPGTSSHVRIRFTPDETKDYSHELICLTARDRIVVPIQAIAAQAILDFPDQLDFSECPVKYSSQKTLLVRNVGNVEAHYQLSTQSPFCVVPDRGTLAAGDTMQVTVGFHPLTVGDHSGSLVVCCNTGECICTNLHGEAVDVNVGLSANSVKVENTFITTSNYTTVLIENRSNITAHFQWKTFPTEEDENKLKRRQCYFLQPLTEVSLENFIEEKNIEQEKGYCEDNTALVSHTVQEEMAKVKEDPMLFSDDIFSIEPVEGEIGPNCCTKIKVTFKPVEALEYRSVAYCNISGRESRLPLHLIGEGQGPFVELSSHTLNLGNIFVNTPYVYEVKLINQAPIDAPFTYICTTANVGYCFKFAPEEGIIAPGGIQTIQISFNATVLGRFEEEFQFSVAGSPTPAILTIKGHVCEPTVHFNVDELDFGDISFGFPYTMTCRLTNPSPASLRFKLRMSDDGTQPAHEKRTGGYHTWVTLCSNTVMDFCRRMLVDLEGIGNGVASVTIMARCLVPELRVYPHVLLYDECRLKVPYERKFLVVNNTDLPGCYGLIPQKRKEDTPVFYSSPKPCGIVQPHSIAEIPVTIEVQTLGEHRTSVLISVFGDERNPRACKPHCYVIEPREGVIPATGDIPVTITATLDDTGIFADTIQLFIGNSLWTTFMLLAVGTGTTIVMDKPFVPELSLGHQFRLVPCICRFKVTNRGHHFHRLFWSVECHSPPKKKGQSIPALSSPLAEDDCQSPKGTSPVFGLEPLSMELQPGESVDMVLRGFSPIEQPCTLEFGCILAGTAEGRSLEITNCSPRPVQYHWSFHSDGQVNRLRSLFIVTLFSRHERCPPKFKPQPPKEKRTCLDYSASQRRRFKIRNGEDPDTALRESWDPVQSLGAEVFSILPQSGVLQPGERQKVSFSFFGHLNTIASVTALCHVEGGPTYEVELTGEASCISYALSLQEINCGFQIFNEIRHSTVTLANTGKIKFNWVLNPSTAEQHLPGVFLVIPPTGSVAPGEKQVLKFSYMPGVPGAFSRTFQLKVGDLDPENICLKGEAFFPVISVNLPWNIEGNEKYEKLIKPLQQFSQRNQSVVQKTQSPKTKALKFQTPKTQTLKTQNLKPHAPGFGTVPNTELQIETVMMLIEEAALELQEKLPSHPPYSRFPDKKMRQSLVKAGNSLDFRQDVVLVAVTLSIVELPEYVLDMGTVRKGYTERRTLVITNPGQIPVSFQVDVSALQDTGFRVNLDQMQGLPHRHTIMFEVCFESTRRPWGDVDVLLPIEVAKGPTYNIHLHATVLGLSLNLSKNMLQFSDTLVGQCQIETVQLYNWFQIPCKWFITAIKPVRKDNQRKRIIPAMRQKQQVLEDEPCPFEVTPSKGTLNPGRWQNLQIQFAPKQERSYKNELKLNICGSSNHLKLHLSGQGLEPRLEFSPPALKMGWVLVDSDGVDATVVVKNPCNFPVEFYSLDFDEQYLEEEKILWMAAGSEYQKNFLMPPRTVGGMLPPEVLEDCEAQKRPKAQQAELKAMAEAKDMAEAIDKAAPAYHGAVTPSPEPMVEVTGSPISQAVMRHLGIDPSSESCEAQQDRGIVVIVHGPPRAGSSKACPCNASYASVTKQSSSLSGKTEIVVALCHYYDTAHLSIDTMVKEAIANDQSQAGRRARELCTKAAMELKGEDQDDAGKKPLLTAQSKNKQASGEKNNMKKKNPKGKNPAAQKKEPASKPNKKDTKQLNIISSHGEELNCLSCVLPEDLLVDILCERLKHEDCSKGVVFDGLESLFTSSLESSLLCVFKAVNNRHHIYMVNLHQDYASWKAKEEAEREKEEWQRKKPIQRSTEYVLQMDEDEDDALPEKKALVDKIIPERKCIQRERSVFKSMMLIYTFFIIPLLHPYSGIVVWPSAENKLHKTIKPQEKVEKKPEQKGGGQRSLQSSQLETQSEVAEGAVRDEHVGVWCLDIQVTDPKAMIREILRDGRMPTKDEMLRHLGLHPEGPPLPPAAVFSIVNYPEEWLGSAECVKPFTIVAPEGAAMEDNQAKAPDAKGSSAEGQPKTHKAASRDNSPKENHISTHRTESPQDSSATRSNSVLKRASTPTEFHRLKRYRWIVPGHGEVELKVHFSTKRPGKFEHTLRFELVETKRQYELPCSGTGVYPSISQNPRLVFPQWRETMEADEIIFKEYVESTKQFHFGPLLCGKSREWYKARNCPGNSENLTILNNSPVDAEVQFSFENDGKAVTFLLDPPSMTLKPKEKQELTIWAYPTSPGFLEDKLICCIEKNPDPVVFSLCCHGVHVMLEVSPLELSFDKLLLHRTDSRTLVLKNNTLLPMAWQLTGLDDLVEAFSLSQDNGIIDPHSEFEVTLNFKAEQIGSIKKTLRLEVSDTGNILGIVQAEDIEISAEVCDVSLSIDMPEGPDGSLEFGTIHVLENVKKVLSLKNKGMYNIEYRFVLKNAGPRMQDLASHFTIEPQSGMLIASQPGVNVEMLFHPTREMVVKNKPILYCQVTDASSGEGSQTVATIPVRVSAKAVYSKYSIEPASPINFGAMLKGTKKTQTVVLENRGMLNFKFHILQAPEDASALESKSSKQEESSPSGTKLKSSSLTQGYLSLGMFTVSPCSGSVAPWGQQKITVECLAGQEGTCEEQLYIDIMGRDPKDNPVGIPFTLIAESCLPALVEDVMLTFEEYPICSSTNLSCKLRSVKGTGLFVREENKFVFTKVLVGQEAEAHFSVYNTSGLPCDVVLSNKPLPGKEKSPINNIFKLYPDMMSIPGSSNAVATVTFTPPEKQNYSCTFKASLVIPKSSVQIKPQTLTFTISGKGHEPQVTVVCPSARSKRGNAVLRFKRLRVGDSEMLPLVIHNNGIVPVKFMLHLEDEHGAFFLKGRGSTLERFYTEDVEEDCVGNESKPPEKPFFFLHHGQSTNIDVIFKPTLTQHLEGKICVLLEDIYSKKTLIELVGEGHKDEFTLDGLEEDTDERRAKRSLKKDIIDAVRLNHIQFGDCPVGRPYRRTFTITNHTSMKVMRFEWEADAAFQFSPKMGHLHPGYAKDITVTLKSDVPATFRRHPVKCKVIKTNSELPQRMVQDWEDRMCIVTMEDTTRKDMSASWPEKEKMVQTAPEPEPAPAYTVDESIQEAKVYLSAVVGYTEFKRNLIVVQLKDTLPNQTRKDIFRIHNTGNIALEYSWMEAADSKAVKKPYSTTLMHDIKDLPLFYINPCHGIIPPGQKQIFHVLFSPKHAGKFRTTILFRTHKLEPALKKVEVIVKGRAQEQESLDKPKRSALRQTDKGQGPKKQVHWKLTPE
ncbi:hydrocephalus-inducing protein homolog [Cinclus cinclus]|uniref:hydrocephalus-inducing protein homolog n=1 Tax=Cinclus cinclus TaxID=127875 RepID=UPI002E149934